MLLNVDSYIKISVRSAMNTSMTHARVSNILSIFNAFGYFDSNRFFLIFEVLTFLDLDSIVKCLFDTMIRIFKSYIQLQFQILSFSWSIAIPSSHSTDKLLDNIAQIPKSPKLSALSKIYLKPSVTKTTSTKTSKTSASTSFSRMSESYWALFCLSESTILASFISLNFSASPHLSGWCFIAALRKAFFISSSLAFSAIHSTLYSLFLDQSRTWNQVTDKR